MLPKMLVLSVQGNQHHKENVFGACSGTCTLGKHISLGETHITVTAVSSGNWDPLKMGIWHPHFLEMWGSPNIYDIKMIV